MLAQNFDQIQSDAVPGFKFGTESKNLGDIITAIIPYLFFVAGALLLINLIVGGLGLMLSRGDPKAVQSAQGKITASIVGFVIVLASYWIVQLVGKFFGIDAIQNIFKSSFFI
jgi:hypothetical protein